MASLAVTYYELEKYMELEKLDIQVLDANNRILGMEHPNTVTAMANLAVKYGCLGKYPETEKLEIQVFDARSRILGLEHPDTINAMENLALTYQCLEKNREAEKLEKQVLDARNRILWVEYFHIIIAMTNPALTFRKPWHVGVSVVPLVNWNYGGTIMYCLMCEHKWDIGNLIKFEENCISWIAFLQFPDLGLLSYWKILTLHAVRLLWLSWVLIMCMNPIHFVWGSLRGWGWNEYIYKYKGLRLQNRGEG